MEKSVLDPFILGAAVLAAAGTTASSLATFLQARRNGRSVAHLTDKFDARQRVEREGVLLCDYVDKDALLSLAEQYAVKRAPDETEETRGEQAIRRAGVQVLGADAGLAAETSHGERELYRHPTDFNVLTGNVLVKLEGPNRIQKYLLRVPPIGPAQLKRIAAQNPDVTNVDELLSEAHRDAKVHDFEAAFSMGLFLLVENDWSVLSAPSSLPGSLCATRLGTVGDSVELPPGVRVIVPIEAGFVPEVEYALVTAQGRQRFRPDERVRATVLGRTGSFDPDSGTLSISPIVIFSRVGGSTMPTPLNSSMQSSNDTP